jgi:hypothetical protein
MKHEILEILIFSAEAARGLHCEEEVGGEQTRQNFRNTGTRRNGLSGGLELVVVILVLMERPPH